MAEEVTKLEEIKTASDGMVKISIEMYNELVQKVADQKISISTLNDQLSRLRNHPPVINRTIVEKTAEMAARDHKAWGTTFMGLGASMFVVGAIRFKLGHTET